MRFKNPTKKAPYYEAMIRLTLIQYHLGQIDDKQLEYELNELFKWCLTFEASKYLHENRQTDHNSV